MNGAKKQNTKTRSALIICISQNILSGNINMSGDFAILYFVLLAINVRL